VVVTPRTLCVDVGGTAIKAAVLDAAAEPTSERVRIPTTYPLTPDGLAETITSAAEALGEHERASIGFPGLIRDGLVITAPFFVRSAGPGSSVSDHLESAWIGLDLSRFLGTHLPCPVRVENDADVHGAAIVEGRGLEVVITLGTGFGSAVFLDGAVCPHLELAHHPFVGDQSYNEYVGDAALHRVGALEWDARVRRAIVAVARLLEPDRIWVGGGNARHLRAPLPEHATLATEHAGLIGGVRLWDAPGGSRSYDGSV
jgi:polyphosphate glucokinase